MATILRITPTGTTQSFDGKTADVVTLGGGTEIADTDLETLLAGDPPGAWMTYGGERHLVVFPGETLDNIRRHSEDCQREW